MIFIAGVSPKTTIVDRTPRQCPACGLARARLQRVDHYLNLFFIPVFRVKKGTDFLFCDRCDRPANESPGAAATEQEQNHHEEACSGCGQPIEMNHRFCPHCGQPHPPHAKR